MNRFTTFRLAVAATIVLGTSAITTAGAQESGIRVRSVRVLATDPEALAKFYEKTFGMSETRRPPVGGTSKELVIKFGFHDRPRQEGHDDADSDHDAAGQFACRRDGVSHSRSSGPRKSD